jgi:hypothetical protein
VAELWILWLGTLLFVRYVAHFIFHRMSYHRGIYHSILAAIFFACLTVAIYHVLGRPDGVAWLAGAFMFVGYLVHLTLDEIYSVDVMDTRIKASFGTALKFIDRKLPGHSAAMALAMVAAFWFTPPAKTFIDGMRTRQVWAGLHDRLLPKERWFGLVNVHRRATTGEAAANADEVGAVSRGLSSSTTSDATSTVTTGSIPGETKTTQ